MEFDLNISPPTVTAQEHKIPVTTEKKTATCVLTAIRDCPDRVCRQRAGDHT